MSLTTMNAAEVLSACETGAAEASDALSRALDGKFKLAPRAASALAADALPDELFGPGLVVVLQLAGAAAVVVIPEATDVLPAWYSAPDATGVSKLATLAQELGMLLLPEAEMPDDFAAFRVADVAGALTRGALAAKAHTLELELSKGAVAGTAHLIWPLAKPAALPEPAPTAAPKPAAASPPPVSAPAMMAAPRYDDIDSALPELPAYTRSLLKIRVPIVVTLARSKQPVSRIIELAPGSIIPFAKSCEDTLILEVNNREVAMGEAVKVGDKFGLRITSMTMPPEKFIPLKGRAG